MRRSTAIIVVLLLSHALTAAPALAQAAGRLVAEVGGTVSTPDGPAVVASLNLPVDDGLGRVGFTGSLVVGDSTEAFVFYDNQVVFRNDAVLPAMRLEGREAWMGVGSAGQFLFSPSIDGVDGLWGDQGEVARRGVEAPGFPGQFLSFLSRPGVRPSGGVHWMAGLATTPNGITGPRAFYTSPNRTLALATPVLAEGEPVEGLGVTALDFNYSISDNGVHQAFIVTRATGSTATDRAVAVDFQVVAQEGMPVAAASPVLWSSFDLAVVDNGGHHLVGGDTNAAGSADEMIVYDGVVALTEGQAVDGVTLGTEIRGIALRNDGYAVWAWTTSAGATDEALFAGQAADLGGTSQLVLRTGDGLDTTGDGSSDYTVADFEFATTDGHGALDFGSSPVVYARLSLVPVGGGAERDAIVGLDLTPFVPSAGEPDPDAQAAMLSVQPNPIGSSAVVTLTPLNSGVVTVELVDVLGRRLALLHEGPVAGATPHSYRIDGAGLRPGVYVVRATGAAWSAVRRIVHGG